MKYKILVRDNNGYMQFVSEKVEKKSGGFYLDDYSSDNFEDAKGKFIELLDLYKITQLKIVADLEEKLLIDIKTEGQL